MTGDLNTTVMWFRRDLRVSRNPALDWALANSQRIIAIFIHSPDDEAPWSPGAASRWWLHHSLSQLQQNLSRLNIPLYFFAAPVEQVFTEVIPGCRATQLVWNECYEPHFVQCDLRVKEKISELVTVKTFTDGVLFRPGTVLNKQDKPYRVFTPFWKSLRAKLEVGVAEPYTIHKHPAQAVVNIRFPLASPLEQLPLLDRYQWHQKFHHYWRPGETQAIKQLDHFLAGTVHNYAVARNTPGIDGTSLLSPHLHFGEISPQQIYAAVQPVLLERLGPNLRQSLDRFITELGWREFAKHIIWHYPQTAIHSMNPQFEALWDKPADQRLLSLWQTGRTGIPIVDAGMRQLWEMGWMHNRVRMIAGSFLTKNLGIHWRQGAAWFWDTLVDADLASNSMGWQWVAGCGVDAAPYYRIFNPQTQAERFDGESHYIQRWLPEYQDRHYPEPVVNLAHSRAQALKRYKELKQSTVSILS